MRLRSPSAAPARPTRTGRRAARESRERASRAADRRHRVLARPAAAARPVRSSGTPPRRRAARGSLPDVSSRVKACSAPGTCRFRASDQLQAARETGQRLFRLAQLRQRAQTNATAPLGFCRAPISAESSDQQLPDRSTISPFARQHVEERRRRIRHRAQNRHAEPRIGGVARAPVARARRERGCPSARPSSERPETARCGSGSAAMRQHRVGERLRSAQATARSAARRSARTRASASFSARSTSAGSSARKRLQQPQRVNASLGRRLRRRHRLAGPAIDRAVLPLQQQPVRRLRCQPFGLASCSTSSAELAAPRFGFKSPRRSGWFGTMR